MQISAKEFSAKYKSKKECYNFLTVEVGAYLSHYETVTIYFLRDIVAGRKKCKSERATNLYLIVIKCNKVKVIFIPHYENLTCDSILERAE